jgi:enoyl-CoA hydratase
MSEQPQASDEPVRYERSGAAAVVTIDRQHRRNAVDGPTAALLHDAYLRFEADDEARVMVLTGAGGVSFCAGADLKATETFVARLMSAEGPMGFTRLTPSKPTIAAISGFALAGGLELALWCDLRIAAEGSTLGYPERRWGVPLIDGGTQRLPRIVGLGRALDLILTGRLVDAEEALRIGLVNAIADPVLEKAVETAHELAAKSSLALALAKRLINMSPDALDAEADEFGELFSSADAIEGLTAFAEKRAPKFVGR